jgi:hypothetical protein
MDQYSVHNVYINVYMYTQSWGWDLPSYAEYMFCVLYLIIIVSLAFAGSPSVLIMVEAGYMIHCFLASFLLWWFVADSIFQTLLISGCLYLTNPIGMYTGWNHICWWISSKTRSDKWLVSKRHYVSNPIIYSIFLRFLSSISFNSNVHGVEVVDISRATMGCHVASLI